MDDDQSPVIPLDDAESINMYQDDNVDNVDLYEDLDLFCSTRSVTECSLSYTELQEKLREKETQLNALRLEVKQLAEQNICLKKNISCLFRTAKNELQCKDKQINLLHSRLVNKPGKKARKKKTPNVNNTSVATTSGQSHKSTISNTQTITTNSITNNITNSTNAEISRTPVTISSGITQCNNDCIETTSSNKESVTSFTNSKFSSVIPLSQEMDVKSTRMITPVTSGRLSNDIPLSVVNQEVDGKSTRTIGDTISSAPSNGIPLSVVGPKVDGKSTRMINDAVSGDTLSNDVSVVRENDDEAVNITNSLGEDLMDNDTQVNVPAEVSVDVVDNCDHVTADGESQTLSMSDGELLSGNEEGNPPVTGSCDSHNDATVSCDAKVLSRQPASRSNPQSSQSRHQGNHQKDHHDQSVHHSGKHSERLTSRMQDEKPNTKSHNSRHIRSVSNDIHQSSSCGSHDSSKRLHHISSESHDSLKRLHRTSSGSHDSSRSHHTSGGLHDSRSSEILHHSSSDSSKLHHTSSRSHDPSKRLHHNSSGSHDSKSRSSGSHDSSRLHHASSRSHDSSQTLHHRLSGLYHSSSDSSRRHSLSGSQNSSRTGSSQHNSTSDQRRTSEHGSGATRGPKRHYSNHGSSRDTTTKRKRST